MTSGDYANQVTHHLLWLSTAETVVLIIFLFVTGWTIERVGRALVKWLEKRT